MTEKLITIARAKIMSSSNGTPWVFIESDTKQLYSCWVANLFPYLQAGKTINCRVETKGKYTNILDILPDDGQLVHTKPLATARPPESAQLTEIIKALNRIEEKIDNLELADPNDIDPTEIPF